jgi:hypothetical protein
MEFEVGADFLYWKPCISDLDYAAKVTENTLTTVEYDSICPEWEPGVRAFLRVPNFYCDWGLSASYTFIESTRTSHVNDDDVDFVVSPLTSGIAFDDEELEFEDIRGHWNMDYHEWDVLLSYDISCNQCHHFKPYFGLAGIVLDQDLKVTLENDGDGEIHWESNFWAVGFRAGSEYQYQINDCWNFFTCANATLLAGSADTTNHQTFENSVSSNVKYKDDDCCQFVPGYHIGAGLEYSACMCDMEYSFRFGYEFLTWFNVPNHRVFFTGEANETTQWAHSSSPNTRELSFHGLFAGLSVKF